MLYFSMVAVYVQNYIRVEECDERARGGCSGGKVCESVSVSVCVCVCHYSEGATGAPSAVHQRASPNENATLFPLVKAEGNISK